MQVRAVPGWFQISLSRAGAPPLSDRCLMRADTFLLAVVDVFVIGQADLDTGADHGVTNLALFRDIGHVERAADTVNIAFAALVVL